MNRVRHNKVYLTIIVLAIIVLILSVGYIFKENILNKINGAHFHGNSEISIENIQLDVFYVAPQDRAVYNYSKIESELEELLTKIDKFHTSQFGDKSKLNYQIFHEPVILYNNGIYYDTNNTARGNPEALKSITLELEERFGEGIGDVDAPDDHFRVIAIIYEGIGASGTKGSILLSRDFVSKIEYVDTGASLFYHEFAHALGIPEGYDILTNQPFTNDIMGSGRRAPIETNYIDQSTLEKMGVF